MISTSEMVIVFMEDHLILPI